MSPGPLRKFLASSVGSKVLVAITGLCLFGFLVVHLAGNMLLLVSPPSFNAYAHKLTSNPLLVPAELGLAALFLVHAGKAVALTLANRKARPAGYQVKKMAGHTSRKSWASSTMVLTGGFILVFLVLHLMHFKYGPEHLVEGSEVRDLHRTVVEFYRSPLAVGFYVVAMVVLGMHLRHGFSSAFQSLGVDHPALTPKLLKLGWIATVIIAGGFLVIPLVLFFYPGGRP